VLPQALPKLVMSIALSMAVALPVGAQTRGDQAFTCNRAADKINSMVEEWRDLVVEHNGQAKNAAVLQMAAEHRKGRLKANFKKHCNTQWASHQRVFVCFSGSVSALGLALCLAPDDNPNNWQYP
jgi:cell division protein FtsL